MRVVILHSAVAQNASIDEEGCSAVPADEEDTLLTARAIQIACTELGWESVLLPCTEKLLQDHDYFCQSSFDVIFNLTESMAGCNQLSYQGALVAQRSGIPYTGGTPFNIWFTTNKILTKQMLKACGIPTPNWLALHDDLAPLIQALQQGPFVIKPVSEDASIGINQNSYVSNELELRRFFQKKDPAIKEWFAEQYIEGREFNVCMWQRDGQLNILPIKEIQFLNWHEKTPTILDYAAKWHEDSFVCINTVNTFDFSAAEQPLLQKLTTIALDCWHLLQLEGYIRLDIRVDTQGQPWVLEINVNPAIAENAAFFACASRVGYSYPQMIKAIVEEAFLSRKQAARMVEITHGNN